jgi:IS30 family transposase
MGGYRLSVEDRNEIWRLHGEGGNAAEIAAAVGRAYSSVATVLRTTATA